METRVRTQQEIEEDSCWNDSSKDFKDYMNNREWFERILKDGSCRCIKIDCDRTFTIGKDQRDNDLYGEILEIYPIFQTVSAVFMYEQGWSYFHNFDEVKWG